MFLFSRLGLYGGWLVVSNPLPLSVALGGIAMIFGVILLVRWGLDR